MVSRENIRNRIRKIVYDVLGVAGMCIRPIYRVLVKNPKCIVNIEGGLASQLEQYTLGQVIKRMGYDVSYDLSFYKNNSGRDVTGKNPRTFDLEIMNRSINISKASEKELKIYKLFFRYSENIDACKALKSDSSLRLPVYLGGYGYGILSEKTFEQVYAESVHIDYLEEDFGSKNVELLNEIKSQNDTIGMHVRRGDTLLAKVGRPIPKEEYYLKALSFFDESTPVYIFSDDMEWVSSNLLSRIPNSLRCKLVKNNGADRAWCDLVLMAACSFQIKSPTGGLGREAFRLNQNANKKLIMPVLVLGNNCSMEGNIIEVLLDDDLCDLSYVKDRNIRL